MDEDSVNDNEEIVKKISELYDLTKDVDRRLVRLEEKNEDEKNEILHQIRDNYISRKSSIDSPEDKSGIISSDFRENIRKLHSASHKELPESVKSDENKRNRWISNHLSFLNMFSDAFNKDVDIDPGRLLALTDGIYGMVLTLLAFGIGLPDTPITSYSDFAVFVQSILPNIGAVIISFVIAGTFWVVNHEIIKIRNMNIPFLWLNIIHLIGISFIPFTTSVIGNYGYYFLANTLFGLNIMFSIFTFILVVDYGSNKGYLEENIIKRRNEIVYTLIALMVFILVINILNIIVSPYCMYLFLLLPVLSSLISYECGHKVKG